MDAYLRGVAHTPRSTDLDPLEYETRQRRTAAAGAPAHASGSPRPPGPRPPSGRLGRGGRALVRRGHERRRIARRVVVDADVGAKVGWFLWVGLGMLVVGLLVTAAGAALIALAARRRRAPCGSAARPRTGRPPGGRCRARRRLGCVPAAADRPPRRAPIRPGQAVADGLEDLRVPARDHELRGNGDFGQLSQRHLRLPGRALVHEQLHATAQLTPAARPGWGERSPRPRETAAGTPAASGPAGGGRARCRARSPYPPPDAPPPARARRAPTP